MKDSNFNDLIKSLYSALVQPTGFKDFLSELIRHLNLLSGSIVMVNNKLETANIIWVEGVDISDASLFINRHEKQDPLMARLQESLPGELITMGVREAKQTQLSHPEFFQDLNENLDIYYAAATVLANDKHWVSQLFFQRSKNQGEFSFEECLLLEKIIPHIQHAMQLYHLKLKNDKQHLLSELLFDQIQLPVILLDEQGYISHCNQQAELFFAQHQYLKKINETLHWINVRNDQQIQQAIKKCLQDQTMHNIQLETPDCVPVVLTFVPLINKQSNNGNGIALFIYSDNQTPFNLKTLCELYNLSSKEGLVCCELINGRSPAEIAEITYLSYETVRTYIKRIMKKTDTKRQSELVAKVLASPACNPISTSSY